ncbi:MAG: hypothetical protein CR968_00150 [Flavobacteriia bacterium]|nr:MAG: hypothetical protein CR968_00150 [Flavobacteriia bacterium]
MKPKKDKAIVEYNAIPLWEVVLSFFVMLVLLLFITKYIIIPLTGNNSAMQTQLIVLVGVFFLFVEFLFHKKRSKPILIKTSKETIVNIRLPNSELNIKDIYNLCLIKFIFKKSLTYIL